MELLSRSGGVCERAGCPSGRDAVCLIRHLVHHNGNFRRLCSSCVLLSHPAAFCSACLSLLSPDAPAAACSRCRRFAVHLTCSSSSFVCPSCAAAAERRPFSYGSLLVLGGAGAAALELDERAARILLVAAQIAHLSVSRAAAEAREEAERRVREAAVARKQSRDALDAAFKLQQPAVAFAAASPTPPSTSREGGNKAVKREAAKDDWRGPVREPTTV